MKRTVTLFTCMLLLLSVMFVGCAGDGGVKKVQTIVDQAQDQIATMKAQAGGQMDIEIEARGTSIVYKYTMLMDLGGLDIKDELEKQLDAQKATFEALVTMLKTQRVTDPSVIVEYLDKDGNMILEKEYK